MRRFRGFSLLAAVAALALVIVPMTAALADGGGGSGRLSATPWIFVGTAAQCAPSPAGSRIVTSAWLGGMGLPDDGTSVNGLAGSANDPHMGLLLNKNGPTPDCSSSGATINGVKGMIVGPTFALGFDYRLGGHCGAGAGRYNVTYREPSATTDSFSFVGGCANDSSPVGSPQDPLQWNRVRFETSNPGESFPVIPVGSRIVSIDITYDEGTDTANNDTQGVGLAVLDNIYIDGKVITRGSGVEPGGGGRENDDHGGHGGHGGGEDNGGGRNGD